MAKDSDPASDEEALKLMDALKKEQAEIKKKLAAIAKLRGTTAKQASDRLARENFNDSEWKNLQNKRKKLLDSLQLSEEMKNRLYKDYGLDSKSGTKESQEKKERLKRTFGSAPRRGWLPMR